MRMVFLLSSVLLSTLSYAQCSIVQDLSDKSFAVAPNVLTNLPFQVANQQGSFFQWQVETSPGHYALIPQQINFGTFHWSSGSISFDYVGRSSTTTNLLISNVKIGGSSLRIRCLIFGSCSMVTRTANLTPCLADFNGSSMVDDVDFVIFVAAYDEFAAPDSIVDMNHDGVVDDTDFVIFATAYDALLCP